MISAQNLSSHAHKRISQRGISARHIDLVLQYGTCIYKQGLVFYYIQKADLMKKVLAVEQHAVRNLIVVESDGDEGVVVTAYKNLDAVKKIRKKTKYMLGKSS